MRASEIRTMSRTPFFSSFFGIGSWPHSGMPGRAVRPGVLHDEHRVLVHLEIVGVDARPQVVVVVNTTADPCA